MLEIVENPRMNHTYNMDCLQGMIFLKENSVDITVTSPPYDDLREYEGYSWDFEGIVKELYRITKDGGVVVWVVSDATKNGSETCTSFKQALYFRQAGFLLHDTMIWVKDGGGAIGSSLCYTQNFEYMFVFSKGKPKSVNLIYDKINQSFGKDKSGVGRRNSDGTKKIETRKISAEMSRRNNWWYIPPQKGAEHPAVFPLQLAKDHIKSWSNEGDLVLDPFMGSGTTGLAALELNRRFIGFEISEKYSKIANERTDAWLAQVRF